MQYAVNIGELTVARCSWSATRSKRSGSSVSSA